MIVPFGADHVDQVARLHCAALTGLLSELGEPAARAFYAGCIRTGSAAGFVDLEKGEVRGFVLGSVHPAELKRAALLSDPAGILAGISIGILRRPSALAWLAKSLRGPDEGGYNAGSPELTYLAVSPACRKSGIGGDLVDTFTQAMRGARVPAYELSVDDGNGSAIAFYEGRGFTAIGRYREFGSLHRRYRLQLFTPKAR